MSFTVEFETSLELLADRLITRLRASGGLPADPFQPVRIGVPDGGISAWLEKKLAHELGVVANLKLDFPGPLLEHNWRPDESSCPWEDTGLLWTLIDILTSTLSSDSQQLEPVRRYLEKTEKSGELPVAGHATVSLASELARLFYRYLEFRPDLGDAWSRGLETEDNAWRFLGWQRGLWEECVRRLGIPVRLQPPSSSSEQPPLRIFAPAEFAPIQLRQLRLLSAYIPVEIYCLVHSEAALRFAEQTRSPEWLRAQRAGFEERFGLPCHPLYAACGIMERDLLIQLVLSRSNDSLPDFSPDDRPAETQLARIQRSLVSLSAPVQQLISASDNTLSIHRCHGARRQVEVLQDLIRHRLDDDPSLRPRDILVLVPQMSTFAPIIDAVFRTSDSIRESGQSAEHHLPSIPYAIVGQGVRRLNPVADVLLRVLKLGRDSARFEASTVLELLSFPSILERFGLTQDDVLLIREWIGDSGIRWGSSADAHATVSIGDGRLPADPQNSWAFGLERLLFGVVMADEPETFFHDGEGQLGVRPIDDMEGARATLVGRFADFVQVLMDIADRFRRPHSASRWFDLILGTQGEPGALNRLMAASEKEPKAMRRARTALETLRQSASVDAANTEITVDGLHTILEAKFNEVEHGYQSRRDAVTFAPIRSHARVPARCSILLGFDAETFPQAPSHRQFDLTIVDPRLADRPPGLADRARFLDAVMSAQESLAVIYTGFDLHTNESVPPSIVVSELCDAANRVLGVESTDHDLNATDLLVRDHPLQAFSPRAFHEVATMAWSYDPNLLLAAQTSVSDARQPWLFLTDELEEQQGVEHPGDVEIIELAALKRFMKNPGELTLRNRFKMSLQRQVDSLRDRETIELAAGLEAWQVRDMVLRLCLGNPGVSFEALSRRAPVRREIAQGGLPWGEQGRRVLHDAFAAMKLSLAEVEDALGLNPPLSDETWSTPQEIDLELLVDGRPYRLVGRVDSVRDRTLIKLHAGAVSSHRLAASWLDGLALAAMSPESSPIVVNCFLGGKTPTFESFVMEELSESRALTPRAQLERVVRTYLRARRQRVPFFSHISYRLGWALRAHQYTYDEWASVELPAAAIKQRGAAVKKVGQVWEDMCNEPVERMLFGGWNPLVVLSGEPFFEREFFEEASAFWWPAFTCRKTRRQLARYLP